MRRSLRFEMTWYCPSDAARRTVTCYCLDTFLHGSNSLHFEPASLHANTMLSTSLMDVLSTIDRGKLLFMFWCTIIVFYEFNLNISEEFNVIVMTRRYFECKHSSHKYVKKCLGDYQIIYKVYYHDWSLQLGSIRKYKHINRRML